MQRPSWCRGGSPVGWLGGHPSRAQRPKPSSRGVTKKQKIQALLKRAEKAGMKPEEIAQRLGLDDDEG